jgi:ketosteroid isomerase-like protein
MSVAETRTTLDGYMHALLTGGDFGAFFSDDVVWTTMETGEEIRGRGAVRDFIVGLHTQLFHATPEVRGLAIGDGVAGLEAVFIGEHVSEFAGIPPKGARVRLPYTVFYDVEGGSITALRAYLSITALTQQLRAGDTAATV